MGAVSKRSYALVTDPLGRCIEADRTSFLRGSEGSTAGIDQGRPCIQVPR